jgi:hypothetical protein
MSNNKQSVLARIIEPSFQSGKERRKWLKQQSPEFKKVLRLQQYRDAGASSGRRRREKKKDKEAKEGLAPVLVVEV